VGGDGGPGERARSDGRRDALPLVLAAPIAFVGGLSRAVRAGVIVKGAGVLERLGTTTVLLDKTGTVTSGDPEIEQVVDLGTLPSKRDVAARRA
jgi:cation transport ATPase